MEEEIRYGSFNVPGFLTVAEGGGKGERCKMGGIISEAVNEVFEHASSLGFNCTVKTYTEIGGELDEETGNYTGLIGALLRGEFDYSGMVAYYPVKGDEDGLLVEQSVTFQEDTMTIISAYNVTSRSESIDMLMRYRSIPIFFWIYFLLSFLVISILMKIGMRISNGRNRSDAAWITARAFLSQSLFIHRTWTVFTLSFVSLFYLFFTLTYANNSVSTDLVVVDRPHVIETYGDVIDHHLAVGFSNLLPEYGKFKSFPPGSVQSRLIKSHVYFSFDPSAIVKYQRPILDQRFVVIGREVMVDAVGYAIILTSQTEIPNLRILRVQDPRASRYTNSVIWSKRCNARFKDMVKKLYLRMQSVGYLDVLYKRVPVHMIEFLFGTVTPTIKRKLTRNVETIKPDLVPIKLINLLYAGFLFSTLLFLSFGVLLFEISGSQAKQLKEKRSISRFKKQKPGVWIEAKVVQIQIKVQTFD